ncbi:NADH-FMN oxidoreductase RutF, flavin reductase (DIM6/NTAB) family [Lachnospiraceae bacterium C10]|nr:NADH-FMN oxidoreductase RutF, flavin reductase (DIM6/NTAB) family [Lachnospiraceae bacterium C10]
MAKQSWKPGNMLYPIPAVLVSCKGADGEENILTVGWAGTINTNPPMLSISVRPERHSYELIRSSKEFVVNLATKDMAWATDYCGVVSGRDVDKFAKCGFNKQKADVVSCPMIAESPVNIECRVTEEKKLGSHSMFIAKVVAVHADETYMDAKGKFSLASANPIVYCHGEYFALGAKIGRFGYSVRKNKKSKKRRSKR